MEFREITAKTVDEAITKACLELGTSSDNLEITVVREGTNGFFGIGSKPAIIKVRKKMEEEEFDILAELRKEEKKEKQRKETVRKEVKREQREPKKEVKKEDKKEQKEPKKEVKKEAASKEPKKEVKKEASKPQKKENKQAQKENAKQAPAKEAAKENVKTPAKGAAPKKEPKQENKREERKPVVRTEEQVSAMKEAADKFLKGVFRAMELPVEITLVYDKDTDCLEVDFEGEDMGILIGKRGQTLDSLQYLTSLVVNKEQEDYVRVKLDTENYRSRRKDTLENLARNIAYKVRKTRKAVVLEPMNPYERRIIHSALQGNKFVETYSEGNEPYRHVVVVYKGR